MVILGVLTVLWREALVFRRKFWTYLSSGLVGPLLYLTAFGWGLGRGIRIEGIPYLQFVVPGIIALASMNNSFSSVAVPLNLSRLYVKTYEEFLIAPLGIHLLVFGKVLAGCGRGLFAACTVLIVILLFGVPVSIGPLFWLSVFLNSFIFATIGFIAGILIKSHDNLSQFTTLVVTPMSFLCNTFFSLQALPRWIACLIKVLPLTHASLTIRAAAVGQPFPWPSLFVMLIYSLVLYMLALVVAQRVE